jgi:RNA polymerase sigma factor (sigma-70 family)
MLSEADQYLLTRVRQHDAQAWEQLVARYQGRLCAFARARAPSGSDAEDLVQEAFLQFLLGLSRFRGEASIETFLFTILRRRLADELRRGGATVGTLGNDDSSTSASRIAAPDLTASTYAATGEEMRLRREALGSAIEGLTDDLKAQRNLRDLKVIELLLFAQQRNKDVALALGLGEQHVAVVKHRFIAQLRARVDSAGDGLAWPGEGDAESLLTQAWLERRPTCPKRSTIGRYCLGNLDEPWKEYVEFHIEKVGCVFCRANLDDLGSEAALKAQTTTTRILQSTIGFFRAP